MFEAQGPFPEAGWDGVWVGTDPEYGMPFEVLAGLWSKSGAPTQEALKAAHKKRLDRRAVPLAVFAYDKNGNAWLYGPSTDAGVIELTQSQGQRLLQSALNEPDASSARTLLLRGRDALAEHGDAGVLLQGLFSDQQILRGLPKEAGWQAACERGAKVLAGNHRDIDLVRALGYQHKEIAGDALLLSLGGEPPRAVAILLRSSEAFDAAGARFSKSPIYHGLEIARRNNVPWLVVARGSEIRLYPTSPSVGVGRRGATQTYFGLDLALIDETKAGYLDLAFSANALAPNGSVDQILNDSKTYVAALSSRLRDRVYEDVVSRLSVAVAEKLRESGPLDADRLALAYRLTLKILFRLLFQAYAEDIRVLPFQRNERYTAASLKQLARHMAEEHNQADSQNSTSLFDGLVQVWRVIDHGDPDWGVPAYNGGLFGTDPTLHSDGAAIEKLKLTNDILGPALRGLLVDIAQDGTLGPVDFRSLDVRDFGTIYEGLLEAGLSIADVDLTYVDGEGWRPAAPKSAVDIVQGQAYFHTKSGDRKATGSFFTPAFAVEHLLERSLDPALESHLDRVRSRVDSGDQVGAARAFFDFRVADLAMGSGHFLVAAISHIEQKFGSFLEKHPIPGVEKELLELRDAATMALKDVGVSTEIDRSGLLSRQIAKRCVYGLDINEIAVELARLAIWVRTFVPGLPMSSLDHQLVWANSLTGIASTREAIAILAGSEDGGMFEIMFEQELGNAARRLEDVATLKEATAQEAAMVAKRQRDAIAAAEPAKVLFDAAVAVRLGYLPLPSVLDIDEIKKSLNDPIVSAQVRNLRPGHFPLLFPEVFLREPSGFDVLLGNPPWEKAKVEEQRWWGLRFPGLFNLPAAERQRRMPQLITEHPDLTRLYESEVAAAADLRKILTSGQFPGIGRGDPDLYQAFAWRNWVALRNGGLAGLVLPRGAMTGGATSEWREEVLLKGGFRSVVLTVNSKNWLFPEVHPQYAVTLNVIAKASPHTVRIAGPFHSQQELQALSDNLAEITYDQLKNWSDSLAIPAIDGKQAGSVFSKLREHPRFDSHAGLDLRPHSELHPTNEREVFRPATSGETEMDVWGGATLGIWGPNETQVFAVGSRERIETELLRKMVAGIHKGSGAYAGLTTSSEADLPWRRARVSFRRISNSTNRRTAIVCLVPPGVALSNGAEALVAGPKTTPRHEAYALGILCSLPYDWQVRKVVDLNFTFDILRASTLPIVPLTTPAAERLVALAGSLAAIDDRYASWAAAVGVKVGSLQANDELRAEAIAEIDAIAARLYGLERDELTHIFETFHRGWDSSKPEYVDRLDRALQHYDAWAAKA